ncbi:T9SS type A sorting domain-containing protein [Flavobacterium sp. Arc2]|uniref:T9SS type A sorting domain-containing protein n=1 Tax=Flavobacterium sp. Arc2 TaxID=3046685 RepID=UPI00352C7F2E
MRKFYFLLLALFIFSGVNAQIINFPDANFKTKLLSTNIGNNDAIGLYGNSIKIDSNNNGEIEVSEALEVYQLYVSESNISDLTGINNFSNLRALSVIGNNLSTLDLSGLKNLEQLQCQRNSLTSLNIDNLNKLNILYCNENKLTTLDFSSNKGLVSLYCSDNQLTDLKVSGCPNLHEIICENNLLTMLDLSNLNKLTSVLLNNNLLEQITFKGCSNLQSVTCRNNKFLSLDLSECNQIYLDCQNNNLVNLNLKNGLPLIDLLLQNNPNLTFICTDDFNVNNAKFILTLQGITNCEINSYCSFSPGGNFYTIRGKAILDTNGNGCDSSDISYSNLNFSITNGVNKGNLISNNSGNYSLPVGEGMHTITPILENPNYFSVSPSSIDASFPSQNSPFTQDFCVTPNGVHPDLEVTLLPIIPARPGFDATYKIIYKNKGTTIQSGAVSLSFNDAVLDYISANPAVNSQVTDRLSWDYINLQPFETREIAVTLNVNSPMETPAVNIGDRLSFNAVINPITGDEKPIDNSFALRQSVVGSYDPNDKTCLEGNVITPSLIGEYVHYMIRFENTGTYRAQNIVVKDLIDLTKFNISSLVPTKGSHEFVSKISEENKVEFIFENINLPFDDANNDGYIAFKIKTLPTLVVGDTFQNEANIYFDYNFPILTNKATSTFKTLATSDFEFSNYFSVFPNPVNEILNINYKNSIEVQSIAIYDILGQMVIAVPNATSVTKVDVSKLASGKYFLKMNTDKGSSNMKFIKN